MEPLGFTRALLDSPTFIGALAGCAGPLLFAGAVAILLLRRLARKSRPRLSQDSGLAVVTDFVITMPLLMATVSLIVQFSILLHAALVVHYAAYAAAHTVRVHAWEEAFPRSVLLTSVSKKVQGRCEGAARYALISASPADSGLPLERAAYRRGLEQARPYLRILTRLGGSRSALERQAGYAFHPRNARIRCGIAKPPSVLFPTARATVEFDIYTGALYGRLLGNKRSDGLYVATLRAQMSVL